MRTLANIIRTSIVTATLLVGTTVMADLEFPDKNLSLTNSPDFGIDPIDVIIDPKRALVNDKGHYLGVAKSLIGSLSAQDKADYIAEFKLLETNEQKAAWFKKVIVAETSVENAIQFVLKGANSEVVSAYMLESGLITKTKNGYKVDTTSDAYANLKTIRSEKWGKHVGDYEPIVGITPINPDLGVKPIDSISYGQVKANLVNEAIAAHGYAGRVSGTGMLTFSNGKTINLQDATQVAAAKAAIHQAKEDALADSMEAYSINIQVPVVKLDATGDFQTSVYTGVKIVGVTGESSGESIHNGYAQVVVGIEESYNLGAGFSAVASAEAQVGYQVSGVSPAIGLRYAANDRVSFDMKAEYLQVALDNVRNRVITPTFNLNISF